MHCITITSKEKRKGILCGNTKGEGIHKGSPYIKKLNRLRIRNIQPIIQML